MSTNEQNPAGEMVIRRQVGNLHMEHCCYRSAIDFFIRLFAADQSGILTPSVYFMGEGSSGQLGTGSPSDTNEPQLLGPSPTVFRGPVAAGEQHTLVTGSDGGLWITGGDTEGQFGDGPGNSTTLPLDKMTQVQIKSVAAGSFHSLILLADNSVMAAGEGDRGELGNGGFDNDKFSAVSCLPAAIKKIAASTNNSFVISESGELWVFGEGINGQVGTGEQLLELTPTKAV